MGEPTPTDHERTLASAFDGQAAKFERAPVQTDPEALARLVRAAELHPDSLVLDAGCGPGLVAEAFLRAGHRVFGVDLSAEMVARARRRCEGFGDRATFANRSLESLREGHDRPRFDAAVSRYVLHHVPDPRAFVAAQAALVRPGGVVVLSDHTSDPDPARAAWHNAIEALRDRSHTRCLAPAAIADLFAAAGLVHISLAEEPFTLDFDEWFDRGTPAAPKAEVRGRLRESAVRGFAPESREDGGLTIHCLRAIVRGVVPTGERNS
jgi:2-polyprenyl-3-methyl-5-hydroxy-6-metoxy-1,4-benzoquinol methylase